MFHPGALQSRLDLFESELMKYEPNLAAKLEEHMVSPAMYAAQPLSVAFFPLQRCAWSKTLLLLWEQVLACRTATDLDVVLVRYSVEVFQQRATPQLAELFNDQTSQADFFESAFHALR